MRHIYDTLTWMWKKTVWPPGLHNMQKVQWETTEESEYLDFLQVRHVFQRL
jgi:hypothetical protein